MCGKKMKNYFTNYIGNHKKEFKSFSEITKVRLVGLIIFLFIINLHSPIVVALKGIYLSIFNLSPATIIAILSILSIIIVRLVPFIMKKIKLSNLYKLGILFDIMFTISSFTYFYSPALFVWLESIIGIFNVALFISISNTYSNFIHYFEPENYTSFQNYRTILIAEIELLALLLSAFLTGFFSYTFSIMFIILISIGLIIYQVKKISLFEEYDFAYMLRYHRDLKEQEKRKN